jgi:hypothetical protein
MRINEKESHDVRHKLMKKEEVLKSKERIVVSLENKLHQIKKEKDGVINKLAETKKTVKNGNKKNQLQKKKDKSAIIDIPILIDNQKLANKEIHMKFSSTIFRSIEKKMILLKNYQK